METKEFHLSKYSSCPYIIPVQLLMYEVSHFVEYDLPVGVVSNPQFNHTSWPHLLHHSRSMETSGMYLQ